VAKETGRKDEFLEHRPVRVGSWPGACSVADQQAIGSCESVGVAGCQRGADSPTENESSRTCRRDRGGPPRTAGKRSGRRGRIFFFFFFFFFPRRTALDQADRATRRPVERAERTNTTHKGSRCWGRVTTLRFFFLGKRAVSGAAGTQGLRRGCPPSGRSSASGRGGRVKRWAHPSCSFRASRRPVVSDPLAALVGSPNVATSDPRPGVGLQNKVPLQAPDSSWWIARESWSGRCWGGRRAGSRERV